MAKISIIVPIYNVEQYLDKCLKSLIAQTYKDIEIICVDDCSTDASLKIAKSYAKKDSRIKIIKHKKNSGISKTRNTGIKNSNAPYLMFCDPDDWYELEMCEKMLNAIKNNNADMAICGVNIIYEVDSNLKKSDIKSFNIRDEVLTSSSIKLYNIHCGVPFKIFKRKIIKKNNIYFPEGLKYEDIFFSNVYYLFTKYIICMSDKLYNYRRRADSIMNTSFKGISNTSLDMIKIALRYFDYIKEHKLYEKQYNYFWSKLFIRCVRTSLTFAKQDKYKQEIFDLCQPFISENYNFNNTDKRTNKIIKNILYRQFMTYKKILGGLIYEYNDGIKHDFLLLKVLSLFKIKVSELDNKKKYYLLGIRMI